MVKTWKFWKGTLLALLVALGGWALFALVRSSVELLLIKVGITSEFMIYGIIIIGVVIILSLLGFTSNKIVKRLSGN